MRIFKENITSDTKPKRPKQPNTNGEHKPSWDFTGPKKFLRAQTTQYIQLYRIEFGLNSD